MRSREFVFFVFLAFVTYCLHLASAQAISLDVGSFKSSPFSVALETLQNQINYKFQRIDLLRRAMTHSSFSEENNKALSVLGASVIETSVSFSLLSNDIEITAKYLNRRIADVSNVETSCALDGMQLGLQKIVRVSTKTNTTAPALVCGTFRAIFGAIAIDKGSSDEAGRVFLYVHGGGIGRAIAMYRSHYPHRKRALPLDVQSTAAPQRISGRTRVIRSRSVKTPYVRVKRGGEGNLF